jgi:hypothetical protein
LDWPAIAIFVAAVVAIIMRIINEGVFALIGLLEAERESRAGRAADRALGKLHGHGLADRRPHRSVQLYALVLIPQNPLSYLADAR